MGLLLNRAEDLVKKDMEKPKMLNAFFVLVFIGKIFPQESQAHEIRGKVCDKAS